MSRLGNIHVLLWILWTLVLFLTSPSLSILLLPIFLLLSSIIEAYRSLQRKSIFSRSIEGKIEVAVAGLSKLPKVGWIPNTLITVSETTESVRTEQEREETSQYIADEARENLERFGIDFDVPDELSEKIMRNTENLKTDSYRFILEEYSSAEAETRHSILVILLCNEIDNLRRTNNSKLRTGEDIQSFKSAIQGVLQSYDFENPQDKERVILSNFKKYESSGTLSDFEIAEKPRDENSDWYNEVFRTFSREYLPIQTSIEYEKAEKEHRRKIVSIIDSELSTGGVQGKIMSQIKDERGRLNRRYKNSQAYLVMTASIGDYGDFYDNLEVMFDKYLRIGRKYINEDTHQTEAYVSIRIVFPDRTYRSEKDFLETKIEPIKPETVFVRVSDVTIREFAEDRGMTELRSVASSEDDFRKIENMNQLQEFMTTQPSDLSLTSMAIDNLKDEFIDTKRILSSVRMKSIAPKLTSEQSRVIDKNRSDIESELGVEDIFDWGKVDSEEMADFLSDLDSDDEFDWKEISEHIIDEIRKSTPPEYR